MYKSRRRAINGCRPFSDAEKKLIRSAFSGAYAPRNLALFTLGIKSGFRVSELLSLTVGDIWDGQAMRSEVKVTKDHMKGKRHDRVVPLHPEAVKVLSEWLSSRGFPPAETFVFQSRQGGNRPITRVQAWRVLKQVYSTCDMVGKLATHSMRKTYAMDMYAALGNDLEELRVALGHSDISTTIRYITANRERIWDANLRI